MEQRKGMTVREMIEQREQGILAPWAARSAESRGRVVEEDPCPIRTAFQRDRDRVVHCRAFRRLAHKTQVFILPGHDHIRTRLTHTLEVAQIAKTLARALCLNEDLTEAIALAHDLGHTPFGHAGEWALDEVVRADQPDQRFYHWEQSLRMVDVLERNGKGLNLTWEVRQGILGHTKGRQDLAAETSGDLSMEGQAVKMSDRIAYLNHDLDDAIRARVLDETEAPASILAVLGHSHSARIGLVVGDIVRESEGRPELRISDPVLQALNDLKEFLFDRVYLPTTSTETDRVRTVVQGLFRHYCSSAGRFPESDTEPAWSPAADESPLPEMEGAAGADAGRFSLALGSSSITDFACRRACDYVAGMTDRFAVQRYMDLFVPEAGRFEDP